MHQKVSVWLEVCDKSWRLAQSCLSKVVILYMFWRPLFKQHVNIVVCRGSNSQSIGIYTKVTVFGTMLGAILVTLINNGLYLIDVGEFWVRFFLGMILLGAVLLDRAREYFTVKNSIVS